MLLQIVTSSVLSFRPDTPCFAGSAPPAVDKGLHAPPACRSYQQRCVMSDVCDWIEGQPEHQPLAPVDDSGLLFYSFPRLLVEQ